MGILNYLNRLKSHKFYNIINTTLIANPYVSKFPKDWFDCVHRNWQISSFITSIFSFYLKLFIKLINFTLQKTIFFFLWREKIKAPEHIFDTFVLCEKVLKNKAYEDFYFQSVYGILEKRDKQYTCLPRIYGLGLNPIKFIKLLKILKKENKQFIFEHQLISLVDLLKIAFQIATYPFQTLQLLQSSETQQDRLFNYHLIKDIKNQSFEAFVRYWCGKKLASFKQIKKIISWSEFQGIERSFNFGYRSNKGPAKIYGAQLLITYPTHFNMEISEIDDQFLSAPHVVLANGIHFIKNRLYKLGVSIRHQHVFNFQKNSQIRRDILLLTSYLKQDTQNIITICEGIELKIKLHPTQKETDFNIPEHFEVVSENIYELFQTAKIVITTGSGTAVEAVAVGVSVIIIASQDNLTTNPLVDYGKGEIWELASSKEELDEKISQLIRVRDNQPQRIEEIKNWYKENFFIEPTEKNIIAAFDL